MKIWLDDERNPLDYGYNDYTWYKEGRELIWAFDDIENQVTNFHLDHYLLDNHITGLIVFEHILYDLTVDEKFKNLRYIYVHTSCDDTAKKYINLAKSEELRKKYNVLVIRKEVFINGTCN